MMKVDNCPVNKKDRYNAIDGLRTFAAIGVLAMHVNENGFRLSGFISERVIGVMGDFVFLFMIISGFSMCCGYYDKITKNEISITDFYRKRYVKVWPYFALLCIIDVVMSPSLESLYELFADLTLCFGLLPNANISVIGVGWFLGLVFVFYILFPFFCFLLSNKRSAWFATILALLFNVLCEEYYFNPEHVLENFDVRSNIVYSAVFFLAGGLIYIYRNQLERISKKLHWLIGVVCIAAILVYICVGKSVYTLLLLGCVLLIYAIGAKEGKILSNPITHFISSISMEIYLCHMIIYRLVEKLNLLHLFENDVLSYTTVVIMVLVGSVIFAKSVQWGIGKTKIFISKKHNVKKGKIDG